MIPNVVEIASSGFYLSKTRGFLSIKDSEGSLSNIDLDEIGVLVITSSRATLSTALMNTLANRGIVTLLCDNKHRPAAYIYPFGSHKEVTGRLFDQIETGKPLKKRLWQSIVIAKILHQAFVLECLRRDRARLLRRLASEVSSGDKENKEAQAARLYWTSIFGSDFRRIPGGGGLNRLLDYGYGVLRSAVLRAIAGSGLNPSLGLGHHSRRNPFCLADDLLEPFRPVVDFAVHRLNSNEFLGLNVSAKRYLGGLLMQPVETSSGMSPLGRAMSSLSQSLTRSFAQKERQLEIPTLPGSFPTDMQSLWDQMDFS